jgi:[ribosomal protein S5]-alanine N-acetyltransferase
MQLALERCTIRPWRLDHAEALAKHVNNRKVWLALRDVFPHPYSVDDAREFLQKAMDAQPTTNFCVEVQGVAAGVIHIRMGQDLQRQTAILGCWLGEHFWGRGIVTEAVAAFADFCFENFPVRRIFAEVFANNPASARVLDKAGFVFEARPKNNVIKDDEILDSLVCARTK